MKKGLLRSALRPFIVVFCGICLDDRSKEIVNKTKNTIHFKAGLVLGCTIYNLLILSAILFLIKEDAG